jgi:putative ABC transport system ATP-binding protein
MQDVHELLHAENIEKYYGIADLRTQVLRDVSLSLRGGECVALLGPSGSGKSTLLQTLGLLQDADGGTLEIGGVPVIRDGKRCEGFEDSRGKNIGFVFQKPHLIPFLSVLDNVLVSVVLDHTPTSDERQRARRLLAQLGMDALGGRMPSELSGGQQQRVAIARALFPEPRVLLADEPTAALDAVRGSEVMHLFRELAERTQIAVLVVTHDTRTLNAFHRVLKMADGELAEPTP